MDDIVKIVKDKTGLSDTDAKKAVTTIVGYIKGKLPSPVASQIDSIIGGDFTKKTTGM